ncbi:hypothetical protein D3C80_2186300 [compost metagenome]
MTTQDTFEWWEKVARDGEALDARIEELKEKHGADVIADIVDQAANVDLEDMAAAVNKALDEEFGAEGK